MALVHKSVGGYRRQKSWNCGANDGDPGLAKRSVDWVSMLFSLVLAFIFCEYNHIFIDFRERYPCQTLVVGCLLAEKPGIPRREPNPPISYLA